MKHIILMGFMGCGKSTIGYKLSYKLKKCLIDTDSLIEEKAGMKISDLFATKGEAYFRELETSCLETLKKELGSRIISLGGGTPIREQNRSLVKELGFVIYLKATPKTIYERTKKNNNRPLLQCENPLERIETMLLERGPVYESLADLVILVDDKEVYEVVNQIVEAISNEDL